MKRTMLASAAAVIALAGGVAGTAAPAQADVIGANNLVNVQITNLLNNNRVTVQVPIDVAANICGVTVDVLSSNLANGPVTCRAQGDQQAVVLQP